MDCDICSVCHVHIDYAAVDRAYPHLSEGPEHFPPEEMSFLEEQIYWGMLCVSCARAAETKNLPEEPKFRVLDSPAKPAKGPGRSRAITTPPPEPVP